MAILKIARMGHPILKAVAEPVAAPSGAETARLVADMIETMIDANGIGLAAPQVHVGKRVVVFQVPKSRAGAALGGNDGAVPLTVLINPTIEPLDDATDDGWEACLSLPGLTGAVPRYRRIRYRGVDFGGAAIERIAEGFHARVVQHECDHLDGVLYPYRMRDMRGLGFVDEIQRYAPRLAAGPANQRPDDQPADDQPADDQPAGDQRAADQSAAEPEWS